MNPKRESKPLNHQALIYQFPGGTPVDGKDILKTLNRPVEKENAEDKRSLRKHETRRHRGYRLFWLMQCYGVLALCIIKVTS
jgi:hypothetical protein